MLIGVLINFINMLIATIANYALMLLPNSIKTIQFGQIYTLNWFIPLILC